MANILVTGAAGFIGSHTVDQLLNAGHNVYGVDNLRTGRLSNISSAIRAGLRFHEFDILDSSRLDLLVRKAEIQAIIHLAALVSVTESIANPETNFRLNIEATYKVAESARQNGVRRLVFASSAAVYGDSRRVPIKETAKLQPISPYGSAKLASEHILLSYATTYGITVRIQRYFNVYGLRQDAASPYSGVISLFIRKLDEGQDLTVYGDGLQTRDFIYVRDVARANLLAATKIDLLTGVSNICTGKPTTVLQLAKKLTPWYSKAPKIVYAPARTGDIRQSIGAPASAKQAFEYVASYSVKKGFYELLGSSRRDSNGKSRITDTQ